MSVNFLLSKCQSTTNAKVFGLRDDNPKSHAFVDELRRNNSLWIATVINKNKYDVRFVAIDKCLIFPRVGGKKVKRCDGALFYNSTVTFVELKERGGTRDWLTKGDQQLRTTITRFEATESAEKYPVKSAYIANRLQPGFNKAHLTRTETFFDETGYVLRIQNSVILE